MIFSGILSTALPNTTITDIEELLMTHNNDEFMTELRSILATFIADVTSQHEAMDKKIKLHTHESYAKDLQNTKDDLQEIKGQIERLKIKNKEKHTHPELTAQINKLQQDLILAQSELSYINRQLAQIISNTVTPQTQSTTNFLYDNESEAVTSNPTNPIENTHDSQNNNQVQVSKTDTIESTTTHSYENLVLQTISKTNFYVDINNTKKINLMKYYDDWLQNGGKVNFCELHVLLLISLLYLKLNKKWSASPSIAFINTHLLTEADRVIPNNYNPNNAIIRDYLNQDKRKIFTNKEFESSLNCFIETVEGKNKFCDELRKIYT